jgi:hypothetical protein
MLGQHKADGDAESECLKGMDGHTSLVLAQVGPAALRAGHAPARGRPSTPGRTATRNAGRGQTPACRSARWTR